MNLPSRESPKGKRVSLFVTCIIDVIYPQTGMSVVEILEHLGIEVDFPAGQTCCGQPAHNSGHRGEAIDVAQGFLRTFENAEVILTPSGSCATMVRHEYPALFADDPKWRERAGRAASITWEFTEFLVDGLGITDLNLALPKQETFAFHDSCHGLRWLGLKEQGRTLLGAVKNAQIEELSDDEGCCGFGGLFSVKMPDVSGAMLGKKTAHINASPAETIIAGDASCLMQMNGGLSRENSPRRVRHIADVLAEALKSGESGA